MTQPITMESLKLLQSRFEARFASQKGISGIGIGRDRAKTGLALHVFVQNEKSAKTIPDRFEGVDVIVDVVGTAMAF